MLIVCTANICRSPMVEALLRKRLDERGIEASVHSAGLLGSGESAPPETVAVGRRHDLDLSGHRSRQLSRRCVDHADVVIALAREHLRAVLLADPGAWNRTYTLKELVRRGTAIGPRPPDQSIESWLQRVGAGRSRLDVFGSSKRDDVDDPYGSPPANHRRTGKELDGLVTRLVDLIWPPTAPTAAR